MAMRQQPTPRQRDDAPGEPARVEHQHHIHHRQPGTHHQHDVVRAQPVRDVLRPGIALVPIRRQRVGIEPRRGVRRQVPDRQHRRTRVDRRAIRQRQPRASTVVPAIDHVTLHQPQPVPRGCARLGQQIGQVRPVRQPRHERRGRIDDAATRKPAAEMVGIVGKRAHPRGADVQQMVGMRRAIRQPFPRRIAPFDQRGARAIVAQQVDRVERARKACADDRDVIDHGEDLTARARRGNPAAIASSRRHEANRPI